MLLHRIFILSFIVLILISLPVIDCKKSKRKKKATVKVSNDGSPTETEIKYTNKLDLEEKIEKLQQEKQSSLGELDESITEEKLEELKNDEAKLMKETTLLQKIIDGYGDDVKGNELIQKQEYITKYGTALHKLGRVVYLQGRYSESYEIALSLVKLHENVDGVEHFNTGQALSNVGAVAYRLGKSAECELAMQRSLYIFIERYGIDSKEVLLHRGRMLTFHISDGETSLGLSYDDYLDVL